jgi:hypothetical protein
LMAEISGRSVVGYTDTYGVLPHGKVRLFDPDGSIIELHDHGPYKGTLFDRIQTWLAL